MVLSSKEVFGNGLKTIGRPKRKVQKYILFHITIVMPRDLFMFLHTKKLLLLGIDGSGEWATTWLGYGVDNRVECLGESFFPHSLGSFYESVTHFCGFITIL